MNKPAPREPSMDEILTSIRQIIADDDNAAAATDEQSEAVPEPTTAEKNIEASSETSSDTSADAMPLSADQIVKDEDAEDSDFAAAAADLDAVEAPDEEAESAGPEETPDEGGMSMDAAEDFLKSVQVPGAPAESLEENEAEAAKYSEESDDASEDVSEPDVADEDDAPEMVVPDDIAFDEPEESAPRAEAVSAMPDSDLSSEMAEELLEPAASAAVHQTFAKLNKMQLGTEGLTLENMIREMLRPMLKEWLDENLPTLVERMVEKEIERVSRGG